MRYFSLCLLLLLSVSCREEFELEADFADIPVVFAYLDPGQTEQFVRVQRVVQGRGGDAGAAAGDPQQLFYGADAATVRMINLETLESVRLDRVDGGDFDRERETGVFAGDPNVLYRLNSADIRLRPGTPVELIVTRGDGTEAAARTTVLQPLQISRPATTVRIDDYRRPLLVSWEAGPEAAVFNVRFIFNIREFDATDPSRDRDLQLTYTVANSYLPGSDDRTSGLVRLEAVNQDIYRFLGSALPEDDNLVRRLDDFDIRVTAAGVEVARLLALENANAGLTSSQSIPRYTNVVGGQGLVTSRSSAERTGIHFDEGSLDSLREGQFTRSLNFQ